jgi:uncharacterized cupredoxin-like copper-binding protein
MARAEHPVRAGARALAVGLAGALMAACGGGSVADGPSPGPYTIDVAGSPANYRGTLDLRTVRSGRAEITLSDFAYSPTVVQAIRGTRVRLTLTNPTGTLHTFTIPGVVDVELEPGATRAVTLIAPSEAGLGFSCRFHAEAGMRGALNDPVPPERSPGAPAEGTTDSG